MGGIPPKIEIKKKYSDYSHLEENESKILVGKMGMPVATLLSQQTYQGCPDVSFCSSIWMLARTIND